MDTILVRYGEIGNKGNNRGQFERLLQRQVQERLSELPSVRVERLSGRMVITLSDADGEHFSRALDRLQTLFGVSSLSTAQSTSLELEDLYRAAIQYVEWHWGADIRRFKVEVRRANKQFPLDSSALARELGAILLRHFERLTVDVHRPDAILNVEIRERRAFLYHQRLAGAGGLPVGMSGHAALLLSGGIDSPVAGWQALRRGLLIHAVHFHSQPFTSDRALDKVLRLSSRLSDYGAPHELWSISVTDIQSAIRKSCPSMLHTILLRRMMFRVATSLADRQQWLALVTGDSLGQVASQTLEALHVLDTATDLPVLRPLVTMDKLDIIRIAEQLHTYPISILPYEDCCTLFAPKSPRTRPQRHEVRAAEQHLDVDGLVAAALATVKLYRDGAECALD
ncbi:MAG: tRNA 4-thiouridine(8) synthase ThiI [Alicyclobacillaceae bacterium]|nr:tRNA 4-thiouridine(8) synthase ThiI [Alicyclobacillaceae bacterium]